MNWLGGHRRHRNHRRRHYLNGIPKSPLAMNWQRVLSMKKKYVKRNRSHFWKKRTNSRLNGQRNPTHRSYWIGTVNADWQIAAKVKSASRLVYVCVNGKLAKSCEWKVRVVSKVSTFLFSYRGRGKLKPVLLVILATNANGLITLPISIGIMTRLGDPSVISFCV